MMVKYRLLNRKRDIIHWMECTFARFHSPSKEWTNYAKRKFKKLDSELDQIESKIRIMDEDTLRDVVNPGSFHR